MNEYAHLQFTNREFNLSHLDFESEFSFYTAVKEGNSREVERLMLPLDHNKLGHLSDNPVRNMKYHLVIAIALITRFCIEGGLAPEDAYTMSDYYIQKLDKLTELSDIVKLHREAVYDFTERMKHIRSQMNYSKPVAMIMDYVYNHLHEKTDLNAIANHVALSKTYMCALFKKETGITIGQYIVEQKVDAAKNMLRYSNYTSVEISNYLGFSSHSYFITSFKNITHMTPKRFRNTNFRSWHRKNIENLD